MARFGIVAHFLQIILNSEPMYCLDGSLLWQESLGNHFFLKKQPVHSGEMNAPFVGVCKAQGPYVGARAAMGQLDSTCHLGFMSCDSHPSGGKSK